MAELNLTHLQGLQAELNAHSIYDALHGLTELRVFMAHHVFSVWDFMSLVKYLQRHIAPAEIPWMPRGDPALRYFINQVVLEEATRPYVTSSIRSYWRRNPMARQVRTA
jgi:hypothetical protein